MTNQPANPYVGPRSIEDGEPFYGRGQDIRTLSDLLLVRRVVLLHSITGAGKTSLVQAGLIPDLRKQGFLTLPVIRLNRTAARGAEVPELSKDYSRGTLNRYLLSAMLSLAGGGGLPEASLEALSRSNSGLSEYLARYVESVSFSGVDGEPATRANRILLVFDQFEEILTLDPRDQEAKHGFFAALSELLQDYHYWALFAMREDYVAGLEPYRQYLPDRLSPRYRLEMLTKEAAEQAILEPVRSVGIDFQVVAAQKLAEDLSQISIQQADFIQSMPGPFVDPVLLQVVCDKLWRERSYPEKITLEDVNLLKTDTALQDYFSQLVNEAVQVSGKRERDLRDWIEQRLITPQGVRSQAILGEERDYGLDTSVIRILEQRYLLRLEPRRGIVFVELAHDRMIEPVRSSNQGWQAASPAYFSRVELGVNLEETGWGVIFPAEVDPEPLLWALRPLLDLRRQQTTSVNKNHYREFIAGQGYKRGENAQAFLERHEAGFGLPDPGKVPRYLLLVGSPEQIPFDFQQELDLQYSVGRLYFQCLKDYRRYARSVAACERGGERLPNRAAIFAPNHVGDSTTPLSAEKLAKPISKRLVKSMPNWQVESYIGSKAKKESLQSLLGGADTPALLLTLTHGILSAEPMESTAQICGALVCQDWPGRLDWNRPLLEEHFFSSQDISLQARYLGSIVFLFGAYTGGLPRIDELSFGAGARPHQLTDPPILAALPQRLLSHPAGGALAVIALPSAAWLYYFDDLQESQVQATFDETMQRLMRGFTAGAAMEPINRQYALLSARLTELLKKRGFSPDSLEEPAAQSLSRQMIIARQFILLGDPATRLPVDPDQPFREPEPAWQHPSLWAHHKVERQGRAQPMGTKVKGVMAIRELEASSVLPKTTVEPAPTVFIPTGVQPAPGGDELDFEITLAKASGFGDYVVTFRFIGPDSDVDIPPRSGIARFDFTALHSTVLIPDKYGSLLSQAVFGSQELRAFFSQSLAIAGSSGRPIRLRLMIDRSAAELQALHWELLRDPNDLSFLALDANKIFSRFLFSREWSSIPLRPRGNLRALVVIANPVELGGGITFVTGQRIAPVDVEGEAERARAALSTINTEILESRIGEPGRASLEKIRSALILGCDILYLVCHAALLPEDPSDPNSPKQPVLVLESGDGRLERVPGEKLVIFLRELPPSQCPRLVVLSSCQSAGEGSLPDRLADGGVQSYDQGALASLAPRLGEIVPAVLAMQANITLQTVSTLMPVFFSELLRDGSVDRAIALARGAVRDRPDFWVPMLTIRLRRGRLWYEPGFSAPQPGFERWEGIIDNIEQGACLPIIGPQHTEFLTGSSREIARRWAQKYQYPLHPNNTEELPQVAQYLEIQLARTYPRVAYRDYLRSAIIQRFRELLPPELLERNANVNQMISAVGRAQRQRNPFDAFRILASLPFAIYLTATRDRLLEDALEEQGKTPVSLYSVWNDHLIDSKVVSQYEGVVEPTPDKPLVFHLFGVLENPSSLVLSEHDYFDFYAWFNRSSARISFPDTIRAAWTGSKLVLGFDQQDWSFRALYYAMEGISGYSRIRDYRSTMVALQPGDENLRPDAARRYLENFFGPDQFNMYWGSVEDFLRELYERWQKKDAV